MGDKFSLDDNPEKMRNEKDGDGVGTRQATGAKKDTEKAGESDKVNEDDEQDAEKEIALSTSRLGELGFEGLPMAQVGNIRGIDA